MWSRTLFLTLQDLVLIFVVLLKYLAQQCGFPRSVLSQAVRWSIECLWYFLTAARQTKHPALHWSHLVFGFFFLSVNIFKWTYVIVLWPFHHIGTWRIVIVHRTSILVFNPILPLANRTKLVRQQGFHFLRCWLRVITSIPSRGRNAELVAVCATLVKVCTTPPIRSHTCILVWGNLLRDGNQ